jgi:O-antigen/teichoic acid export membrane protein
LLFVGLIASIILIIFYSKLSEVLFGSEFNQTGDLIKNMGFGLLGLYFYPIFGLFSVFYDKLFPLVVISLLCVFVNFGIMIFFSMHYGLQGLALGSSAANLVLGFVFGLFVWHFIRSKIYRTEI